MSVPTLEATRSGLRVVTESMPAARSVAIGAWIGVGSRYESPALAGLSHFLEHMLFKGTPTRGPRAIAEAFDGLGGEVNAATGKDYTVLYARVRDDLVDDAFEILADILQRPSMTDLEQEREVVLEEIAMYEDDPQEKVHDLIGSAIFPEQAIGRPVIGTASVIASVTASTVREHHAIHYTAPNVVVAAAGGIDAPRVRDLCEHHLGGLETVSAPRAFEPARPGPPTLVIDERPTEQYHLSLGGPGLSRSDPRRHAQSVLDTILGGAMSSRLFQEIRERRGLAYAVGSYATGYADGGQVGIYLGTREENLASAAEVLHDELRRLAEEPVPEEELRRAKSHLTGRLVLSLESPGNRMNRIGRAVVTNSELLSLDELIARIEDVDAEAVAALARTYWQPEHLSVAAIGPSADAVREGLRTLAPGLAVATS